MTAASAIGTTCAPSSLRTVSTLRPLFRVPRDDLAADLLVPCLSVAQAYDCMSGFFSSSALRDLAPGLASYLTRSGTQPLRLIVSPYLSAADIGAIKDGSARLDETVVASVASAFEGAATAEDKLTRHTLDCLSWLLHTERLGLRIAFVEDGLFHPKVWLISDGTDWVAVHGSSNMTDAGLRRNVEQVAVDTSWGDAWGAAAVSALRADFETLWAGDDPEVRTLPVPKAIELDLLRRRPEVAPSAGDYELAIAIEGRRRQVSEPLEPIVSDPPPAFAIPSKLAWDEGPFAHQGSAVRAWEAAGGRGILAMATGSGKTSASMIAAQRLYQRTGRLLIVVAAPYLPLVNQWADEASAFGLTAHVLGRIADRTRRLQKAADIALHLSLDASPLGVELVVLTNDALADPELMSALGRTRADSLLIADEVHNLGASGFRRVAPEWFKYRLGLSATPVRQFDAEGTDFLLDYIGPVVYEFSLEQAIGLCLVPYDYYVHEVVLSEDELATWRRLTDKLRRSGWFADEDRDSASDAVKLLLIRRRKILEQAGDKIGVLEDLIDQVDRRDISHTLIYASAKGRDQLRRANQALRERGIRFSQLTNVETAQPVLARSLLERFGEGSIQVLTAMKVLDEGVNIPQTSVAYLLASTTGEREWVQRRGRVLRLFPGKKSAVIHDFMVVPPESSLDDAGIAAIVKGQLDRLNEFARLARNASSTDSGFLVAARLKRTFFG